MLLELDSINENQLTKVVLAFNIRKSGFQTENLNLNLNQPLNLFPEISKICPFGDSYETSVFLQSLPEKLAANIYSDNLIEKKKDQTF